MRTGQPAGWPTVIPRLFTDDVAGFADFLRTVFGATGDYHAERPTEMRIGDSIVMVSDGGGLREKMPGFLYVYVENSDSAYTRALDLGAIAIEAPLDTPYGDRRAMIRDAWGNVWQIATRR